MDKRSQVLKSESKPRQVSDCDNSKVVHDEIVHNKVIHVGLDHDNLDSASCRGSVRSRKSSSSSRVSNPRTRLAIAQLSETAKG